MRSPLLVPSRFAGRSRPGLRRRGTAGPLAPSLAVVAALSLWACGPTMGDPCTTERECGGGQCLNRSFTPGGYCTRPCSTTPTGACPAGTVCVAEALGRRADGCMRACVDEKDCRVGYACALANGSATTVCIGPAGL